MNNNAKSRILFNDNELISYFRMVIKESNIDLSMSDELLMCFIHARKGDVHRAMKLLNNYVRMTKQYPKLAQLCPLRVKHVLDSHFFASPHREQNGCRILLINLRKWDLRICSLEDIFLALVFCFQRLVSELETQTNGIVLILDVKDLSLNHVRQFTPYWVKIIADIAQDVFPIRFQGIHVVNEPRIMKVLVAIFWPFLSNKIRSRLFFHGQCFATVHHHVDPACLPNDYNGCMKSMDTMRFSSIFFESEYSKIFDCFN